MTVRQKLTSEQSLLVSCHSRRLRVDAGAGTGKTSTLARYSFNRPRLQGLYLAFNKSVQIEASRRFPANCRSLTLHALAYSSHGRAYSVAGKLVPSVKHASLLPLISDSDIKRRFIRARLALACVHEFTVSSQTELLPSPALCGEATRLGLSPDQLLSDATVIWRSMCDLSNKSVGLTHDAYFKLWALTQPTDWSRQFGYVLVDEAQDLNPVANAVLQIQDVPLVYVGDSAQSICAYRGAVDCLPSFRAETTLQLTKSFRFGSAIADLANKLLQTYKDNPLKLVGMAKSDMVGDVQDDLPYAMIARTNAGVFSAAAGAVSRGSTVHFVGGMQSYGFGRISQVHSLFAGAMSDVTDPFLRTMGSIESLRDYGNLVQDNELKSICRVVEQHGTDIPRLLAAFKKNSVQTPSSESGPIESVYQANVFITNVHKAKGLEFMQVRLADDFPSLLMGDGKPVPKAKIDVQEINLIYVALTRASMLLDAPEVVKALSSKPTDAHPIVASKRPKTSVQTPLPFNPVVNTPGVAPARNFLLADF